MGDVNYYLKTPSKSERTTDGKRLIYLQFRFKGKKLVFTFNRSIELKYWSKKQRVKNISSLPKEYQNLNSTLDALADKCVEAYGIENAKGIIPTVEQIKQHLIKYVNQNNGQDDKPTLKKLMQRFIDGEIKSKGLKKSDGTIANYRQVDRHLDMFETKYRCTVDFEDVTLDFFYKFTHYLLEELKLSNNTVAKEIKVLKVFMAEGVDLGYTKNLSYKNKKFSMSFTETDSVFLSKDELLKFYQFDLSEYPRYEAVRDLFVFGACVGFRYSDYSNIKPENITEQKGVKYLTIRPKKTPNVTVRVPCDKIVLDIFRKYKHNHNMLPNAKENQPFNKDIKEAAKKAGFDETGRLISKPDKPLYECISSHTARRSFATNYYLEGFPTITLMKITGHRTEAAFMKYLKLSSIMAAEKLREHQKQHEWVLSK